MTFEVEFRSTSVPPVDGLTENTNAPAALSVIAKKPKFVPVVLLIWYKGDWVTPAGNAIGYIQNSMV